jgi:hypothetical protein
MRRVLYLTHYNVDTFPFLRSYFNDKGWAWEYVHSPVSRSEYINAFIGAWRAVKKASEGDVIVSYMCSAGVLCWWISLFCLKKVEIIGCNLTLKGDKGWMTRIMTHLYRWALKSRRFTLTVTSNRYGETVKNRLGTSRSFPLLRDFSQYPGYARPYQDNGKRIFFGGNSQRDWKRCLHFATLLPDWKFVLVGWKDSDDATLPPNVRVFRSLPFPRFMAAMSQSTIVLNLVRYNCPAGLIVMMEATWEGRLIATNSNDVIQEYVSSERGIIAENDEQLASLIRQCYNDDSAAEKVKAMQRFLSEQCSAEKYAQTLYAIVDK